MAYTIKSGDRLGSLAKQYNTTVDQLMALNPQITNPNKIYAGQSLNLPGQVQAGPEPIEVVDSAGGAAAAAAGRTTRQSPEDLAAFNAALAASMNSGGGGGIGGGAPSLGVYDEAINNYNNAVAGLRDYYTKYQADQNQQIAQAYENARRQAYVNSRLDAIGNNEVLASMGLSGNLYTSPQSGYTETARIAENLQMRNAIADANTQEKADVNALAIEMMKQNANLDMETAQYLAQLKIDQAKFQEQIRQANIANQMAAAQMALAQQNADRDFAFQQQQFEYQQQQDALAYQLAQQQAAAKSSSSRSSSKSNDGEALARSVIYSIDPATPDKDVGTAIYNAAQGLDQYANKYTQDAINEASHILYNTAYEEHTRAYPVDAPYVNTKNPNKPWLSNTTVMGNTSSTRR